MADTPRDDLAIALGQKPTPPNSCGPSPFHPLLLGIEDAGAFVGVKRSTIYKAIKDGELERVKIGSRTLVPVASLRKWVES